MPTFEARFLPVTRPPICAEKAFWRLDFSELRVDEANSEPFSLSAVVLASTTFFSVTFALTISIVELYWSTSALARFDASALSTYSRVGGRRRDVLEARFRLSVAPGRISVDSFVALVYVTPSTWTWASIACTELTSPSCPAVAPAEAMLTCSAAPVPVPAMRSFPSVTAAETPPLAVLMAWATCVIVMPVVTATSNVSVPAVMCSVSSAWIEPMPAAACVCVEDAKAVSKSGAAPPVESERPVTSLSVPGGPVIVRRPPDSTRTFEPGPRSPRTRARSRAWWWR